MKTQKVDASKASSIINNNALKQNKCKFVMQFFIDDVPRFAIATAKCKTPFKKSNFNDSFKSLCISSLQFDVDKSLVIDKLVETINRSNQYKKCMSEINNSESLTTILLINAKYNEFKNYYQNDFDFNYKMILANFSNIEFATNYLKTQCKEICVSENDETLFLDYNNPISSLLHTEFA
jgi:hypothetical protein